MPADRRRHLTGELGGRERSHDAGGDTAGEHVGRERSLDDTRRGHDRAWPDLCPWTDDDPWCEPHTFADHDRCGRRGRRPIEPTDLGVADHAVGADLDIVAEDHRSGDMYGRSVMNHGASTDRQRALWSRAQLDRRVITEQSASVTDNQGSAVVDDHVAGGELRQMACVGTPSVLHGRAGGFVVVVITGRYGTAMSSPERTSSVVVATARTSWSRLYHAYYQVRAVLRSRWVLRHCDRVGRFSRITRGSVVVDNRGSIEIGDRARLVGPYAPIELRTGEHGRLVIGDRVFINDGTSLHAATSVIVGDDVDIGPNCVISDTEVGVLGSPSTTPPRGVVIGDRVWLATRVVVRPGAEIGAGTVVAAASVVEGRLPPNVLAAGTPARVKRQLVGRTG